MIWVNHWDETFQGETYYYGTEPNAFLKKHVDVFSQAQQIACYAEGEGRNAVFLARKGHEVTAFDYAEVGLQKTVALANSQSVHVATKQVDLINDRLEEGKYDGAVMIFGHFAKADQYEVLDKISGSLKVGGVFLLEVYEEAQLQYGTGGPQRLDFLYNEAALASWAKKLDVLHFACVEENRVEGAGHTGKCKVLQLIGRKRT